MTRSLLQPMTLMRHGLIQIREAAQPSLHMGKRKFNSGNTFCTLSVEWHRLQFLDFCITSIELQLNKFKHLSSRRFPRRLRRERLHVCITNRWLEHQERMLQDMATFTISVPRIAV